MSGSLLAIRQSMSSSCTTSDFGLSSRSRCTVSGKSKQLLYHHEVFIELNAVQELQHRDDVRKQQQQNKQATLKKDGIQIQKEDEEQ